MRLNPTKATAAGKGAGRNPRAEMAGTAKTGPEYISQATTREDAISRIKAMAAAGWTREQIEAALKGSKWE